MVIGMTVVSRSRGIPGRRLAVLGGLVVALGAAFVVGPLTLAAHGPGGGFADRSAIITALRSAFVEYWDSGSRSFPASLGRVVDYWSRYHVAKAVIAALLLAVLVVLGVRLWSALLTAGTAGPARKIVLASTWLLVALLALVSAVLVVVNVRGAIVPFSSLMSMLPVGAANRELATVVDQVRGDLSAGGRFPVALDVMVSDFARFHAVLAVLAVIVAIVLAGPSALSWRGFTRATDRWTRRVLGSFGVLSALVVVMVVVVAVANAGTAANPTPALLAFFTDGS